MNGFIPLHHDQIILSYPSTNLPGELTLLATRSDKTQDLQSNIHAFSEISL